MTRYRVSKDANADLDEIFAYWAVQASSEIAERLIDEITDRFWLLGQFPGAGRPCPELAPGLRSFPVGKYLIYYRKTARSVEILHVFHGARDQRQAWRGRGSSRN
jgi:toxin ParE1/3/4